MQKPVEHPNVGPNTKLKAIEWWQTQEGVHPMTCGNNSDHTPLVGRKTANDTVYLECPDCDYLQDFVPDIIWQHYIQQLALAASGVGLVDNPE